MTTEAGSEEPHIVQETSEDRLDPWFKDGNIVLISQGKHFRVHRGILAAYSTVFKDMFDCIEPEEDGEKSKSGELIEGCPVVDLHDAATDLQIILKAMYDRSYPLPYYEKVPLSTVSVFLRLGEKYDIERLTHEAKARLVCAFKPSIASRISSSNILLLFQGITGGDPHNFLVMNLLHDMDLKSPLPLAMYQCAISCPVAVIIDGYEFQGSHCSLSHANLRSWILTKNILEQFQIQLAQSLRVSSNCVVRSGCALHLCRIWSDDATAKQPFGPWRQEWDKLFCDVCKADLKARRITAIQKAWDQIPTAFGFGSWVDVAKDDNLNFPSGPSEWRERLKALITFPQ